MPKFILTAIHPKHEYEAERKTTLEFEDEGLNEVLDEVAHFLRGVGYYINGDLIIEGSKDD